MTDINNIKITEDQVTNFIDNSKDYIAHVCLNSKLSKNHKDYCNKGFIDISPYKGTNTEQC